GMAVADGTSCDDGNPCMSGETCELGVCGGGTTATDGTSCDDGNACTTGETCQSGTCTGGAALADGTSCDANGECSSGKTCSAGLCAGGSPAAAETACVADDNVCTRDVCDTSGRCIHPVGNVGTVCRAGSGDACDPDEVCTGVSSTCPSDVVLPNTFTCRAAAGECDIAETCGGLPGQPCPADAKKAAGSLWSAGGTPCTADVCDG